MATSESVPLKARRWVPWLHEGASRHFRDYAWTFATEFVVLACQLFVYKVAAQRLGEAGFAEYAVARRTLSFLQPVALLGLGVALARYVAFADEAKNTRLPARYFQAAFWMVGAAALVMVGALLLARESSSFLFFGSAEHASLLLPLSVMLVGLSLHSVEYAYFRGRLAMSSANLLQMVNLGIGPLVVVWAFGRSTESLLMSLGVLWSAVAAATLFFVPPVLARGGVFGEATELLRYGVRRVPGDFALMALLALPSIVVAHRQGLEDAGYVAFGVSIVSMIASLFSPIGVVLLPYASRKAGSGELSALRRHATRIAWAAVLLPAALVLLVELFAEPLIRAYLGLSPERIASTVRVLALGAVPLSVYFALRSLLDAFYVKAVNTRNLFAALGVFLAVTAAGAGFPGRDTISAAFVAATALLAAVTCGHARHILQEKDMSPVAKEVS